MNPKKVVGISFDGVVVKRSELNDGPFMIQMPGLRKVIRQINHKGFEVVCTTLREGKSLDHARHFIALSGLRLQIVDQKTAFHGLYVFVSDEVQDLHRASSHGVANLFLCRSDGMGKQDIPARAKIAVSLHELMTQISKCLG
jgi:hypothetical protein